MLLAFKADSVLRKHSHMLASCSGRAHVLPTRSHGAICRAAASPNSDPPPKKPRKSRRKSPGSTNKQTSAPDNKQATPANQPPPVPVSQQPSAPVNQPPPVPVSQSPPVPVNQPTPVPINQQAPVPVNRQAPAFGGLEEQIATNLTTTSQPGLREDWEEVEGCWVLGPPASAGRPKAIVHFIGGAFVGAAPQLSYRLLLESLAARGLYVIAVPFATGFNHLKIANEIYFKLERCQSRVFGSSDLPVYGVGHSMGSLMHVLIATQYPAQRAGNALMSFNNKDVLEAIPFFAPFIAPGARALAPILSQLAVSPLRSQLEAPLEILRGLSPALVRQFLPILDQLLPIYMDISNGKQGFTPAPAETKQLIRSNYGVPKTLVVRFEDDKIDETSELASTLTVGSAVSTELDLTVKVLPGDHITPLLQKIGSLPPELANAVSQGNSLLNQLSNMAAQAGGPVGSQFQDLAKGVSGFANDLAGGNTTAAQVAAIEMLAASIDEWIEAPKGSGRPRELPPPTYGGSLNY